MEHKLRLRLIRNPQTKQERKTSKLQNERAEMPAGYAKKQRKGCKAFRERSHDIRKRWKGLSYIVYSFSFLYSPLS